MKPGIIILAAGASTRMGTPKQLLSYAGKILLQRTIDTAHCITEEIVVVLGAHAALIRSQLTGELPELVENRQWQEGMGGSLALGLKTLLAGHPDMCSVILLLCDQPLLTSDFLEQLIATHQASGSAIAAAEYNNTLGVPALFSASLFPKLLALAGGEGARKVIQQHRAEVAAVPFPEGALDIDTPADFAQLAQTSFAPSLQPA